MDKLEEFNYLNELLATYGKLLTDTQYKIMEQYYCFNLSLSEIAENSNISRTAVSDCLKKSISKLEEYEVALNLIKTKKELLSQVEKLKEKQNIEEIEKLEGMIKNGI